MASRNERERAKAEKQHDATMNILWGKAAMGAFAEGRARRLAKQKQAAKDEATYTVIDDEAPVRVSDR